MARRTTKDDVVHVERALERVRFAVEVAEDAVRREPDQAAGLLNSGLEAALEELADCRIPE